MYVWINLSFAADLHYYYNCSHVVCRPVICVWHYHLVVTSITAFLIGLLLNQWLSPVWRAIKMKGTFYCTNSPSAVLRQMLITKWVLLSGHQRDEDNIFVLREWESTCAVRFVYVGGNSVYVWKTNYSSWCVVSIVVMTKYFVMTFWAQREKKASGRSQKEGVPQIICNCFNFYSSYVFMFKVSSDSQ